MNKYTLMIAATILSICLQTATANAESAQDNYRTYCMQCHGMDGHGMGLNIRDMSVQPRDHTDTKSMSTRSDAELFKAIKEGGLAISKSSLMPPWADLLTDHEIHDLVKHLRKLCNCKNEVK